MNIIKANVLILNYSDLKTLCKDCAFNDLSYEHFNITIDNFRKADIVMYQDNKFGTKILKNRW